MIEDKIQAECVKWFTNNYCLRHHTPKCVIFSVPNGGLRNKIEAMKLVTTGMKAGVSDLVVLMPGRALFVEVKTDIGIQSKEQIDFEADVVALGFQYFLIRSIDEFKAIFI
jgi:hypothetical protein